MPQMSYGNTGRFVNEEWHRTRLEARVRTVKIDEWSDIDQVKYDLDTVDFDRKQLDREYRTENHVESEGGVKSGFDIRELPTRD